MLWTGRILMVLAVLFLLMDSIMRGFSKPAFVVAATIQLGYPESTIVGIGVALLVCTIVYIIPQTSILGAILLTGYLGGAVATNVRAGTGLFNTTFPIVFAVVVWGALWLQNPRLRKSVAERRANVRARRSDAASPS